MLNKTFTPIDSAIFVPIPPSKAKSDPLYDDRLVQVLEKLKSGWMGGGYRELLIQNTSTEASHRSENRRDIQSLINNYSVDRSLITPSPQTIIIFDDVITTGCHYQAAKHHLQKAFPNASIAGVFVARRALDDE